MIARVALALRNEREKALALTTYISYERFGTGDGEPGVRQPAPFGPEKRSPTPASPKLPGSRASSGSRIP